MTPLKEFGVFLPIANGGWIVSTVTPPLDGGWQQNRDAALIAEEEGFDFVMAMGKWRGFGGATNHWGSSLEAVTMLAGIAALTSKIKVWATLHAILHNPAVAAKMIATLDHVSGGRAGLNIVAGSFRGEFEQMGAWDTTLSHDARYGLTEEWTKIVKRLWTEPSVSFDGRHFQFRDCVSEPKPLKPPFLICAGMSARGFDFSVRECDGCFIGGATQAETKAASLRAKALAAELGKTIKTYCMMTVITAPTDAGAEARAQEYRAGLDEGAVRGMLESYGLSGNAMTERSKEAFMTQAVIGSPATCAAKIADFLRDCQIDGLMFIFDDYAQGLRVTGREILPLLRGGGMTSALLLIDFQVDFGAADGAMAKGGANIASAQAALTPAMALAAAARAASVPVIFVRLISAPGPGALCIEGTRGADFIGPQPQSGERIVSKKLFSAFHGTGLAEALREAGVRDVVLAGLTTECCVAASAWAAFEYGLRVGIASDACAAYEPGLHDGALEALRLSGAQLGRAADFAGFWK